MLYGLSSASHCSQGIILQIFDSEYTFVFLTISLNFLLPPRTQDVNLFYGGIFILKNKKVKSNIFALTLTSVMIAMSVVFCRFIGFSPEGTPFRFEIGFLPIAYLGYMLGPLYSGLAYLIADIIGSLFSGYAPNIWISACQFLSGFLFGIFLHKKKLSLIRTLLAFGTVAILVDFLLKSPVFVFMYDWTWGFTLGTRAINAAINLVVRVVTYYILAKLLNPQVDKLSNKI